MNKKWIVATVILVSTLGSYIYFKSTKTKESTPQFSQYSVKKGLIKLSILSTGVVQPQNKLEIKPPIAGRVEKIIVSEGQLVKRNQVIAWMSSTERAALVDAARSKGEASLKEWEDLYPATPIMAPINGTIIKRNVETGQTFTTADAIFTMSDRLIVKAQVDETDIAKVKLKQNVKIVLDAYADHPIEANVDKIAFDATTINNVTTYIVDVLPYRVPDFMRSGMTANVTFELSTKANILVVPSSALSIKLGKNLVLIPAEKMPLEKEVEVGITDGKMVEISSGLNENDIVLVPEFRLEEKKSGGNPFSPMGSGGSRRSH
jgi:macrolide-specific efflux system membrane fusion protein